MLRSASPSSFRQPEGLPRSLDASDLELGYSYKGAVLAQISMPASWAILPGRLISLCLGLSVRLCVCVTV
ncbi:hypothetical protein KC19_4G021200 [Ceratodon purpureus]|uniref:Uncharacterized protein n=1 Tax=Ceratodon purpureus TaxID=3225 RepID=A0A8T0I7E4_CERPU|nr:hypothetical protein KC19_4G021200 [Ceratodon purpureus]